MKKNAYGFPLREGGATTAADLCLEVYNPHTNAIVFENVHPEKVRQPLDWQRRVCKPDDFLFLPHSYYVGKWESGAGLDGCTVHVNWGNKMRRGIKPSPEDCRKIREGQRRIISAPRKPA